MSTEQPIIRLYEGRAQGSEHWQHHERLIPRPGGVDEIVINVTDPTLTVFRPEAGRITSLRLRRPRFWHEPTRLAVRWLDPVVWRLAGGARVFERFTVNFIQQ